MKNYRFTIKGLDCANCARKIEEHLQKMEKYEDVVVNFSTSKISLKTEEKENVKKELEKEIQKVESEAIIIDESQGPDKAERTANDIVRIVVALVIYVIGIISKIEIFTVIALIILLYKTTLKAFKEIKNEVLDENTLITISVIGAYLVGKGAEGIMVITLYEIGKILEAKAINKTRKSISDLMNIKPEYANLKTKEKIEKVKPEEVKIGDTIVVKSGEKIPLDGIITKGETEVDNSALTGESKLVKVQKDSQVLSGGINVNGLIEVKVTKTYENSTVNQILNLVENATDKKAKTETFVSKAAKIYTPIVLGLALLVAIAMPLIIKGTTYDESIYKALIFLVISCPCSIAISVPLSYFTGIGKASKKGILVKGSDYLDSLKDVTKIIFDKTGTITTGKFEVERINILNKNYDKKEILKLIGKGESLSKHPIAESVMRKVKKELKEEITTTDIKDFKEVAGKGIEYSYENKLVKIGNADFVNQEKKDNTSATVLYLKVEEEIIAKITLNDQVKEGTKEAIEAMHKNNIETKMFTGDKKEIALSIAKKVGIQQTKYEMLPTDKYKALEKELNENEKVAYVGDGINDSPVLARADIGISMGGIGSSSAIEASDVVIMTDEIKKISEAIEVSKRTNLIIKQNLIFSIGVKIVIMLLSLFGISDMWEAVFADVGVTLITIFNTLRI